MCVVRSASRPAARPFDNVRRIAVVTERSDAVLAADVEDFWLEAVTGYTTTQDVGKVVIGLTVVDGRSGDRLAARCYIGIKRREVDKPGTTPRGS